MFGNTLIYRHIWRDIGSIVVLAVVAFGLVQWVYALPRSVLLSADTSACVVPRAGFYGSEQFPNSMRRYRWSKHQGMMHLPNPGGQLDVWMILAGGPGRSVPVTFRTDTNLVTTFVVAPEPRVYRLLPGSSPHERVGVWLEAPTMKDHQKRTLGVVVGDVFIAGRGNPPRYVLFAAILIPLMLYGILRRFAVWPVMAFGSAFAFLSGLIFVQHVWGWNYAVARPVLVYALMLYAVVLMAKILLYSPSDIQTSTNLVSLTHVLRVVTLAVAPVIVTMILVFLGYGKTLADFVPFYSDEVFYWHQTWTFSKVGFGGGYYTLNEYPARLDTFRFYVHGPLFPMLYGSIAMLVGWTAATGVFINCILITIATGFFAVVTRLHGKQMILTWVFLLTYWAFLLHIPSNMQESMHHAIAIVLAGLFYRLMSVEHPLPRWALVVFFCFIVLVSLLRITWSLLLIPFVLISFCQFDRRNIVVSLVVVVGIMGMLFLITSSWASYYPNVMTQFIQKLTAGSFVPAFSLLVENMQYNFGFVNEGSWLEIVQRYQLLLVFAATAATNLLLLIRHTHANQPATRWQRAMIHFFHVFNLGTIFAFTAIFYDMFNWRDYRLLAPYLIISILIFIASGSYTWVVQTIIIANIMLCQIFWHEYTFIHEPNFVTQPNITALRDNMQTLLHYEHGQYPWCNSVLWAASFSDTDFGLFLAIPPGIGISFLDQGETLLVPLKSKYVILDPHKEILPKAVAAELRYLGDAPPYKVYVNGYATCR